MTPPAAMGKLPAMAPMLINEAHDMSADFVTSKRIGINNPTSFKVGSATGAKMSGNVLPDDPELTDVDEQAPRPHIRRRKTASDYITTISALLGAVAALGVFMGSITDALPFVQKVPYMRDMAAADTRFQKVETSTQQLNAAMTQIQRNGLLTLALQLQQRVDALTATLKSMAPNSQTYYQLSAAHDEAQQQLEEIKRQLGR